MIEGRRMSMRYTIVKRAMDITFSITSLAIFSPIFFLIIIAIKLDSKGPIVFKQKRIGINKTEFQILKFRTMKVSTPKNTPTHLLENPEQYITRIGFFLRKSSLDELPQLINVIKGEMSLVGPRPALWNQYELIEEREIYGANSVKPGLTGWAQIHGRDELPVEIKARYDGEYVKKMGLIMDVKCILRTIVSVLRQDGVVEGSVNKTELKRETFTK